MDYQKVFERWASATGIDIEMISKNFYHKERLYKAVVFDLGNTICFIDFNKAFTYWSEVSGLDLKTVKERFQFDRKSKDFERGLISEKEFHLHVNKRLEYNLSFADFYIGWNAIFLGYLPHIEAVIKEVKKSHLVAVLSNTNSTHETIWKYKYRVVLSEFDQIFTSHTMDYIKPQKEIYLTMADALELPPKNILFIDDKEENVKGAEAVGMKAVQVKTPEQMYADLHKLGVLSDEFMESIKSK